MISPACAVQSKEEEREEAMLLPLRVVIVTIIDVTASPSPPGCQPLLLRTSHFHTIIQNAAVLGPDLQMMGRRHREVK